MYIQLHYDEPMKNPLALSNHPMSRRHFSKTVATAATSMILPSAWANLSSNKNIETIQDVIDILIQAATSQAFEQTVDIVKVGDAQQTLKGITTTFMANCEVIQQTIDKGYNFIVTHEPTFYNHLDETDALTNNSIYQYKRKMLEDNGIVVWRYHDYMHTISPDPIVKATTEALGWEKYRVGERWNQFELPPQTLETLIQTIKEQLGTAKIKFIGDLDMKISTLGHMVGAPGGARQIQFMEETDVEALIVGEINQWEVSEYVRDAIHAGKKKALIIAGHVETEEMGMKWLADWLNEEVPDIPTTHIPAGSPFQYI